MAIFNPVIMAGGRGSRLWPLSRTSFPKQFQRLIDNEQGHTLLQQTFNRLSGLDLGLSQLICNQDHRFLAAHQCHAASIDTDIMLEPFGRNTAPAVILSALRLADAGTDDPMLILAADHSILDESRFRSALLEAHNLAESGNIVTLGIKPTFACTGYGYIGYGQAIGDGFKVHEFKEKPDVKIAHSYLDQGNYLWNSGIFIVRPSILLKEAEVCCPELLHQCNLAFAGIAKDLDFIRLPDNEFSACQNISLDYAILEHTKRAVVVPADFGWSDVGDLHALWKINKRDSNGNWLSGDAVVVESQNCLIEAKSRFVATLGIEGIAVVETKDAVLVASLDKAQQVKDLLIKLQGRAELIDQTEVFRPWGSYESIDSGQNYQVKRITVSPGGRLSVQRHKFRAEHWVVVDGTANVHVDGVDHILHTNDSIYIPLGAVHCLANETDTSLYLVEVQSGSYLGEDDIERLDDVYGRC